jgi:hypothetical protein
VAALLTRPRFSLMKTLREFFNRNKIFERCCCRTTNAGTFFCVAIDKPILRTLLSSIVGFQIVSGFLSETLSDLVDNYATYKHPRVIRWLAARPRFPVHFTLTYASWLNQVEIWFNRNYPTGHSPRVISQRQRTGRESRSIRSGLQHPRPPFRLDRHGRFDLRQSPATM